MTILDDGEPESIRIATRRLWILELRMSGRSANIAKMILDMALAVLFSVERTLACSLASRVTGDKIDWLQTENEDDEYGRRRNRRRGLVLFVE